MLILLSVLVACKKRDPEPVVEPATPVDAPAAPAAPVPPPATACLSTADCPEGSVCEGLGCGDDQPGRCMGMRPCTRDLRMYCGCDGVTFGSSGSCPGRRFAHEGECP
jgi:hypothetical protein